MELKETNALMRFKPLILLVLAASSSLFGQTTPNLDLNVPINGTLNWGVLLNANAYTIDGLAAGYQSGWLIWPLSSKGQLYTFGTGPAALSPGTNGFVLTSDSSQTLGMKWAASGGGSGSFADLTSGTNVSATMTCGTGCSILTGGSGSNAATSVPVAGVSGLTFTGSTTKAATYTGATPVTGDGVAFDASHNLIDIGHPPLVTQTSPPSTQWVPLMSGSTNIVGGSLGLSGAGTKLATFAGTTTTDNCAKWDSNGNAVDAGAPCSGGGGSGTVSSGTTGQFATYPSNGTTVSGHTLVVADVSGLSFTGSTTKAASSTGALTTGNCAQWDASGNVIDAGAPCAAAGSLPSQTGHAAQYLTTNGTVASWGNIVTGVSGALDCVTIQGTCDVVTSVVPLKANANTFSGAQTFSGPFSTQGVTSATDSTVSRASTIAPTTSLVIVTGTGNIDTITPAAGCTTSGTDCIVTLLADVASGPFNFTTAGNIYATYSGIAGQAVRVVYFPSASKWYQIH